MTKIIFELCQNHNGDIKILQEMVHAAAESRGRFCKNTINRLFMSSLIDQD